MARAFGRWISAALSGAALAFTPASAEVPGYQAKVDAKLDTVKSAIASGPFKADWDSLRAGYRTPDWFSRRQVRHLHPLGRLLGAGLRERMVFAQHVCAGHPAYEHHLATYGPQSKFGYKDFIPLFKAEKFGPRRLGRSLFGCGRPAMSCPSPSIATALRCMIPTSRKWDAAQMGPKRDVVGLIARPHARRACISACPRTAPSIGGGIIWVGHTIPT